jgi:23S rRNA pseudouridine1911/1915/1917 synthase
MAAPDPARVGTARAGLAREGVEVLLEDNHLLVVNKPAGLLSQGDASGERSLVDLLAAYRGAAEAKEGPGYVGLVHRLDRNVSGVLVTAKTSKAAARLSAALRTRDERLVKEYAAWVRGVPSAASGTLEARLARQGRTTRVLAEGDDAEDGAEARLTWTLVGRGADAARLLVRLETGVTHQIRAQLAQAGHALIGDVKYGGPPGPRVALHALRVSFPHPVGGAPVVVAAPLPRELLDLERRLGIVPPAAPRGG